MQERTERKLIVFVNAPNDDRSATADGLSGQYIEHSDWANMPHAGLLSIASYLASRTDYEPVYFDGTINHPDELLRFVWQNAHDIQAIGFSMLSANAQTTCSLIRACKSIAPHIVAVIGNDHASFFATSIAASQAELVDAIFIGDSPYGPLAAFLKAAECGRVVDTKSKTDVQIFESARAAEFPPYQFDLIDRHFPHMAAYRSNFRNGVAAAVFDRLGIHVNSAVPIHIAQGCLKFVAKDPCSFCSIYPGKTARRISKMRMRRGREFTWRTMPDLIISMSRRMSCRRRFRNFSARWRPLDRKVAKVFSKMGRLCSWGMREPTVWPIEEW